MGSPHSIAAHTIARLIMSFPPKVIRINFNRLNLAIPRRMITMSSGGIGVIAAMNETKEPYFANNLCKGAILFKVESSMRALPR